MTAKKSSDAISILIGSIVLAIIVWKIVGYILPDNPTYENGEVLLEDILTAHGGMNDWNNKSRLGFTKEFKLYEEEGSVSIDREEIHEYTYYSPHMSTIQWARNNDTLLLKKTKDSIFQLVNRSKDTTQTRTQLESKLNAAQFVINLPFSLKDDRATLTYQGKESFQAKECHVLQANFKDSRDSWSLYFSTKDLSWLGYWVQTEDHYSLVLNEEMIEVGEFTLSRKRTSYRTDKDQNILYLRAQYLYSDYILD